MSNTKTNVSHLAEMADELERLCGDWTIAHLAVAELRRLDAIEQRHTEMMANPCPEWDGKAYMQAIASLRAQVEQAVASKCELLGALEHYLIQDEIAEGYGGGVGGSAREQARAAIAKATGEHHDN